jgi:hypothetical protein
MRKSANLARPARATARSVLTDILWRTHNWKPPALRDIMTPIIRGNEK